MVEPPISQLAITKFGPPWQHRGVAPGSLAGSVSDHPNEAFAMHPSDAYQAKVPAGETPSPDDPRPILQELAGLLSRAADWRRENVPEIYTPQGYLLLLWLLKRKQESCPLADFYESGHFSEPTMRKAITTFTARGLAVVEFEKMDARCRVVRSTPKLTALAEEYSRLL